ncbi:MULTISPECIES: DUF2339 domain-containing protein [Treponema]|uniref:DUF2339 domain-containing protein n=1 Tax=Treponema denticola (strain ATCC 35405 / DSM 14222 / CIP 103919 / JCM 8153 / KCTC 15104) TaxID=243275 RepID=Q73NF9_TREDE|nr:MULTISPECIES: DUF2339 domain-containing protein [Treponema]AAS11712.1 hypothetical protein TDE_1194 [Treponema denticola ATCC 35405]EMB37270.1 hypothetical protein HMPREF9735_01832 [Treponema denticola ATCC 33521]EMB41257.1 hypothetical protein HMPREF9721_00001 [Treponema denticola ATCC 35404]HCY95964.1 DUF2339 domain-containing protein [Treponema sp.]
MVLVLVIVIALILYILIFPIKNAFKIKKQEEEIIRLKSKLSDLEFKFQGNSNVSSETEASIPVNEKAEAVNAEPEAQVWIKAGEGSRNEDNTNNSFVKESVNDEVKEDLKQEGIKEKHAALSPYFKKLFSIESIISKLGIILLLIGVGFIFKLSYDKGYITQEVALIIGGLIGAALCFFGFRSSAKSRLVLSQVLFGGGIAVFYITAYAAYLRYGILGDFSAFIFLSLITAFSYTLSIMTTSSSISIIGLLGSLIIPFAVDLGFLGLTGFGLYVFAVSALSSAVYFFKRWRLLQFISLISFLGVLTRLLLTTALNVDDAVLFFGLVLLLMTVHTIPDLYFYLKDDEKKRDKILSPAFAVLNLGFSLFLTYKLSVYKFVPQSSTYLIFSFFYIVLAYLAFRKKRMDNLGLIYLAGTLVSLYVTVVDRFTYDIQPVLILSMAFLGFWLFRKKEELKVFVLLHILFAAAYIMAIISLGRDFESFTPIFFFLQGAFYLVPMGLSVFVQKEKFKKAYQGFVFQAYIFIFLIFSLYKLDIKRTEIFAQGLTLILIALYNLMHHKLKKGWFYERAVDAGIFILFLFSFADTLNCFFKWNRSYVYLFLGIEAALSFAVYGLSLIKEKTENARFFYRLCFFILMLKILLFDFSIAADQFRYGILLSGLFILALDKFYKNKLNKDKVSLNVGRIFLITVAFFYYIFVYSHMPHRDAILIKIWNIDILSVVINILNALILIAFFKILKLPQILYFAVISLIFVFLSFVDIYLPVKNGGILTLLWAFYSIASFVYYLRKGRARMVYISLGLIIFVAAKLIIIDLNTLNILSKVITSLVFGVALLLLSYAIQPMLKKFGKPEIEKTEES